MYAYAPHINGTDPIAHPDVKPAEVRAIDYLWAVKTADTHINFWTPLAHGNAIEAGWAEEHGIPSIAVFEAGHPLSRLVRGLNNHETVIEYDTISGLQWELGRLLVRKQIELHNE